MPPVQVPEAPLAPAVPAPSEHSLMRTVSIGIAVMTVVFVAAFAAYYYYFKATALSPSQVLEKLTNENLQTGRTLLAQGAGAQAITWLEQARATAADSATKSQVEVNLASAYSQAGSNDKAVTLWKEISLNETYPVGYRVTAAANVIQVYQSVADPSFGTTAVFTGPVWGGFLKTSSPTQADLSRAVRDALLWTDALNPQSPSMSVSYRLANWYGQDLLATTTKGKVDDIDKAKRYIAEGDRAYAAALAANATALKEHPDALPPFVEARIGESLTLKARTMSALYLAKVPDVKEADVVALFTEAIALIEKSGMSSISLFSRYHLSSFLVRVDPVLHQKEIIATLAPLYSNPALQNGSFFQGFLKSYGTNALYRGTATWKTLVALAKADASFKTLLINLGWNPKDLS